jgi:hypothetical protein
MIVPIVPALMEAARIGIVATAKSSTIEKPDQQ